MHQCKKLGKKVIVKEMKWLNDNSFITFHALRYAAKLPKELQIMDGKMVHNESFEICI